MSSGSAIQNQLVVHTLQRPRVLPVARSRVLLRMIVTLISRLAMVVPTASVRTERVAARMGSPAQAVKHLFAKRGTIAQTTATA
jgi:hypothetical protein